MALEEQDTAGRGNDNKPVIVAIGASAGGIPALQSFFSGIQPGTGAAQYWPSEPSRAWP